YTSVQDLEDIVVKTEGPVLLKDVAQVNFGVKDETSISRVNGQDVISIILIRDTQVNQIDLSHSAQEAIEKINEELEYLGVSLHIQLNTAELMENNIDSIKELALIGGLLAIFILWLFIRNFSVVAIVGLAMPISVLSAFNLFYAGDVTINSLTLVGLALAIGMLLDNSVVVLENIFRRYDRGESAAKASVLGTQEVWRALIASTATTITVFLPFLFSSTYEVKLLGTHIGISIGSTLMFSLIVALLLIPMGTHFILTRKKGKQTVQIQRKRDNGRLMQIYTVLLKAALRSPATLVFSALIAFFLSIVITLSVSYTKMEEVESDSFKIYVTMPNGATLTSADELTAQIEEKLLTLPEREDIVCQIFEDEAEISVMLKDDFEKINGREITVIKDEAFKLIDGLTDAEIEMTEPEQSERYGGGQGNQSSGLESLMGIGTQSERILIKGEDFDKMRSVGEDIVALMAEEDDIQRASLGVKTNAPELHLSFDNYLMTEHNITYNEVRSELNSFPTQTDAGAVLKDGLDEYDITIKIKEIEEQEEPPKNRSYAELKELQVESRNSGTFELRNFTSFLFEEGVPSISRVNQAKQIEISYRFLSDINDSKAALEEARTLVDALVATVNLPTGVAVEVEHEVATGLDEFKGLIGIAFLFIFMILASVFESFVKPLVVMFAIPLAAVGSFFALGITGTSLYNANVLTGFLILLGIVVNNSIILIDYASLLQKQGYNIRRSLLMAGQARLRPILITAITTIVAMVPMALGQAEYASMIGAPFAITIIGGLSVSTLLTLVFVPTFYFGLTNALNWIAQLPRLLKVLNYSAIAGGLALV
ncbi:MAG: efflux RND transporter permease subunit, partial [Bacteroidales bacterium]|nr:efflux RND transporter permease subunit [Bacteroidales bacterium]